MPKRTKYISGIHNYCDRWCERCAFTARCGSLAVEKQLRRQLRRRKHDGEPPTTPSWETYDGIAEQIQPWLAAERDKEMASIHNKHEQEWDQPLARRGEAYVNSVDLWFKQNPCSEDDPEIADAVAVIRWYQHFIVVKLLRAASADDFEDDGEADEPTGDPEIREAIDQADRDDNNGSAKVALIGMDRSIAAWTILGQSGLPQTEDLIRQLDALRCVTEQVFPNARAFIRPGLDWPS